MNIKNFFKNLLNDAQEENNIHKPFLHELLVRSEKEQQEIESWLQSPQFEKCLNLFKERFIYRDSLDFHNEIDLSFIYSPTSNGFVLYFDDTLFSISDFRNWFDYFKQCVLAFNYTSYVSDAQTRLVKDAVLLKEKHYLKPKLHLQESAAAKLSQQYGNILIEHHLKNGIPESIKFMVHNYHDGQYEKALPFDVLMEKILDLSQ